MSLQPPKIDKRSYNDIVQQIEALAEDFTNEIPPKVEALIGQTLAEEVKDKDETIASSGKVIDGSLAERISKIQGLVRVKVKGWQPPGADNINPKEKAPIGKILNQDIIDPVEVQPTIKALIGKRLAEKIEDKEQLIAARGTVINADLAEQISRISGLNGVKILLASRGTVIDATLAERLSLLNSLSQVKVKSPPSTRTTDPGRALIRIFGRMAALVSDRLNKVPDKNFLAFLDLIGTQLLPPQPAKVPLTFSLAEGSPVDALVPAHTQVAAPPATGEEDEVVFETDRELVVTTAQLQAVFVREPEKDKYSDRTSQATGKKDAAFEAFAGEQPIEHCLYLACDELFMLPGDKTLTLEIKSPEAVDLSNLPITWSDWDGLTWKPLLGIFDSSVQSGSNTWKLKVSKKLSVPTIRAINGLNAGWLRASLNTSLLSGLSRLPSIESLIATVKVTRDGIVPDLCFFNTVPIDLSKDFYPLGEQPRFNDTLYIASQEIFARPEATVTVNVQLSSPLPSPINPSPDLEIEWEVWNGQNWQSLKGSTFSDTTQAFRQTGDILFTLPRNVTSATVNGENNYWIRARIIKGNYSIVVSQVSTIAILTKDSETVNNKTVLTVNSVRGFMPNDRIQIILGGRNPESCEIESSDNTTNKLILKSLLNQTYPKGTSVMLISGSVFGPPSVKSLSLSYSYKASSSLLTCCAYNDFHYVDLLTTELREEAKSSAKILKIASVAGLAKGDRLWIGRGSQSSEEREIEAVDLEQRTVTIEPALASNQPLKTSVEFFTTLQAETKSGETILKLSSLKQFAVGDRLRIVTTDTGNTQEYEIEGVNLDRKTVTLKSALTQTYPKDTKVLQCFQPFKATDDENPALYLGFDKPFANRPTTLYAQVEPPQPEAVATELKTSDTEPVRLVWEYASPSGWSSLGARDETNAFAERGLIQFIGPTDLIKTSEFSQELYWLRVRWEKGEFRVPPRLRRLLTNTIWATQAMTLQNEILGSSDGNPSQILRTSQKPILQGQQLEVQEPQVLSRDEQVAIEALEGEDAVKVVRDEAGQIEEIWMRWHEVPDFYASQPRDRHYVLDRLTGEVRFGDGQYGMVPPQGRNNVRLLQYQTGGGTQGNLSANTIVQLKTTVPYVDSVTNLEAAGGGAAQESLEQVKERGPKILRHRGRAVTVQDFEDLAYEASPDVARAKAIAPTFRPKPQQSEQEPPPLFDPLDSDLWLEDPKDKTPNLDKHNQVKALNIGQLRLLIVPRSPVRQPVPSLALLDRVENYIRARCAATVDLQVIGPEWQAVSVTATVIPVSLEGADAVRAAVVRRLEEFLHPLDGGKEGQGWVLGRLPHRSDLYGVIESIQGVDYVQSLAVEPNPEEKQLSPEQLIYSGTHTISLILPKEGA